MIDLLANESRENRRPGTPTLIHTLQKPIELTPYTPYYWENLVLSNRKGYGLIVWVVHSLIILRGTYKRM